MDATLKSIPLDRDNVQKLIEEIIKIDIDDNIVFEILDINDIRAEDEYGGFKIGVMAKMDNLKIHLFIEFTTGDRITPREIQYNYNCIFEDKKIPILAYNVETIVAEKFETIISRGIFNTRMKDYYDIYTLVKNDSRFNKQDLQLAIKNTFERRNSNCTYENINEQLMDISENIELKKLWLNYQKQAIYAQNITFEEAVQAVYRIRDILFNLPK